MLLNFEHLKTFYSALKQKMKNFRGNWNQNDPTADDYIKNRPFYSEGAQEVTILHYTVDTDAGSAPMISAGPTIYNVPLDAEGLQSFIVDQEYSIKWNNKTYTCKAKLFDGIPSLGDTGLVDGHADTGEPFLIAIAPEDDFGVIITTEAGKYPITVTMHQEVVHKLDKKFIDMPDNLVTADMLVDFGEYVDETLTNFDEILADVDETLTAVIGPYSEGLSYTLNNNEYTVSGIGTCTDTEIIIPSVVDGHRVTKIGDRAFGWNSNIKSVTIPNSVTNIDERAFSGCIKLTSITIPDSVTSIGKSAFFGCDSLTSIALPDSLTTIGKSAFEDCIGLTSIAIPKSVTSIGDEVFRDCRNLYSITIPRNVVSMGKSIFSGTSKGRIFCEAESQPEGWDAGWNYNTAKSIHWGVALDFIGVYDDLINYPAISSDIIDTICTQMFGGLYTTGTIDSYMAHEYDQESALEFQTASWDDLIDNQIISTYIDDIFDEYEVYRGPESSRLNGDLVLSPLHGFTTFGLVGFENCVGLTSISVSDGINDIGREGFLGCTNLQSIILPSSIKSIYAYAFKNCSKLRSVYIRDLEAWCNIDFEYNSAYVNPLERGADLYLNNELVTELVIPEAITVINNDAFHGCASITNVILHDNVTTVGHKAFAHCKALTNVQLSQTLTKIQDNAFDGCNNLTSITIPNSVTYIGNRAFGGCSNIMQNENEISYVGKWVIDSNRSSTSAVIRNDTIGIADSAFSHRKELASVVIPASVKFINGYAFHQSTKLTNIVFEGTVEQWTAIPKGTLWHTDVPATYVQCTDGQVAL